MSENGRGKNKGKDKKKREKTGESSLCMRKRGEFDQCLGSMAWHRFCLGEVRVRKPTTPPVTSGCIQRPFMALLPISRLIFMFVT